MIMKNGKIAAGWRLDEVTEGGPVGMAMLLNPFAIVPKDENADRIELAFELAQRLHDLNVIADQTERAARLGDFLERRKADIARVAGKP